MTWRTITQRGGTVTDFYILAIKTNTINNCIANYTGETIGNNCQQVCAGAIVVYTANDSEGLDFVWEINGAEDAQISDNIAIVTWGGKGYGQISVCVAECEMIE